MPLPSAKRNDFTVSVQSGILQSLGIDMYSTLGKSLVEFVANAYDGEAPGAKISIPFDDIESARAKVRAAAKARVLRGEIDPFTLLNEALPEDIVVVVRDEGTGMTPDEIQDKFLPITRNRRLDPKGGATHLKSDTGKRFVMGRKGLGKLAGFGVAERIEIRTKKAGDEFATVFMLDQEQFSTVSDIGKVTITPAYEDKQPKEQHYTEIRLSRLKCDAVRQGDESLKRILVNNFFGIDPTDFGIELNGDVLAPEQVEYDLEYPTTRGANGMAPSSIDLEDTALKLQFDYVVKFRKPGAHLSARHRGARIYCNGRLAAGPSLLDVPTGLHSFHSTDYMECVVVADDLDRHGVDLINTNRTQLKENNEIVRALLAKVSDLMTEAIRAHGRYRDRVVKEETEKHPDAQFSLKIIDQLSKKQKVLARRLVNVVAHRFAPGTNEFRELAPLIVRSMNATEVLIKLTEAGTSAKEISQIGDLLRDLAEVERSDVLKLYRGRRSGITALEALIAKGEEFWRKKQFEDEVHDLLRANPWLIRPEYSRYLTSNETMASVATDLARELGVDDFAPQPKPGEDPDNERPDLTFTMADTSYPHEIHIVELKSPALPLTYAHLDQLRNYMFKTDEFLRRRYKHHFRIFGTLIGTRPPPTTTAAGSRRLNLEVAKRPTGELWEVVDLRELLESSRRAHLDIIEALESAENAENEEEVLVEEEEAVSFDKV